MNGSHLDKRIVLTVAGFALTLAISSSGVLAGTSAGLGPGNAHRPMRGVEMLRHWNHIAIDMSGLDHTPVAPGEARVFGEELGPVRASRAMAIVHIAIFDAINAIHGGYRSYTGIPAAPRNTSVEAAIAEAAHDTLVELFPSQTAACDAV